MKTTYQYIVFLLLILFATSASSQRLEEFQQQAINSNLSIQSKYKAFEALLEQIPQAKSLEDPIFSAGYFLQPMKTLMGAQRFKLGLNQQFPWFGTLKAKGDAVALQTEAKYQAFLNEKASLEKEVAEAYFPVVKAELWLEIEKENLKLAEAILDLAEEQYQNNERSLTDVYEVELLIAERQTAIKILERDRASAASRLNVLVNQPPTAKVEVIAAELEGIPEIQAIDFSQHPMLQAENLQEQSFQAQEKFAKKSAYPKIGLGVEYMYMDDFSMQGMNYEGMHMFMPMLSVSIPVFNKKYKSAQKEAQIMQEASQLNYQDAQNQLEASFFRTVQTIEQQKEMLQLYELKIDKTEKMYQLSLQKFENATGDLDDLIEFQEQLLSYQKEKISTQVELQLSAAAINYYSTQNATENEN
ncbi:MAG: TolC family protein [Bacteroidota bacterium]